ncbi:MAG: hypothetical protein IKP57_06650 [Paludibacteraceae bacterium]|nr:hypothetical protein [Paludibacteraceae bacterium]
MRKFLYMALIALTGICLVGCKKDQKDFYLSDLQGLWQNDQTTTWYMRFTADQGDIEGCFWGREWGDYGDDVTEDDLFDPVSYHGNGWFQYKLEKNGDFTYINMLDNKGADVPKSFKMITLTSSKMTFQNDLKEKKNFTKQ